MPRNLPKHVRCVRSKGKLYYYFDTGRRMDGKRLFNRLPDIRSSDFGGAYASMLGHRNRAGTADVIRVPKLIDLYQRAPDYRKLSDGSKRIYDIYLRDLERLLPTAPVAEITRGDMRLLVDGMAGTPGKANTFLGVCGALFKWGMHREYLKTNPCDGIERMEIGEHEPWPEEILKAALAGTDDRVRRLTHLLYYTAQRINDALAMTWGDIDGDHLMVRQRKTGKVYRIPLHAALKAELATIPRSSLTIIAGSNGSMHDTTARAVLKKFVAGFGLRRVPHGLRKNAVIALLEAGCSVAETASISGQSLQMVEHYAKKRDQSKLASAAVLRWERNAP